MKYHDSDENYYMIYYGDFVREECDSFKDKIFRKGVKVFIKDNSLEIKYFDKIFYDYDYNKRNLIYNKIIDNISLKNQDRHLRSYFYEIYRFVFLDNIEQVEDIPEKNLKVSLELSEIINHLYNSGRTRGMNDAKSMVKAQFFTSANSNG